MKPSIEETLIEWFGSQSLEIKTIDVETYDDPADDRTYLYKATGTFHQVGFDQEEDGPRLALEFHQLTLRNWRFVNSTLKFISETEFKIK